MTVKLPSAQFIYVHSPHCTFSGPPLRHQEIWENRRGVTQDGLQSLNQTVSQVFHDMMNRVTARIGDFHLQNGGLTI